MNRVDTHFLIKQSTTAFCNIPIQVEESIPMSITFKKNLTGQVFVLYDCESCGSPLKSNVDEIGLEDDCPKCAAQFVVPGRKEYDSILRKQATQAAAAEAEKESRKEEQEQKRLLREEALRLEEEKEQLEEDVDFNIGFPGNLIRPVLDLFRFRNNIKTDENNGFNNSFTSFCYAILIVLCIIFQISILLTAKQDKIKTIGNIYNLLTFPIIIGIYHYGNYLALSMRSIALQEPVFKVRSKSVLHLIALPFLYSTFKLLSYIIFTLMIMFYDKLDTNWKLYLCFTLVLLIGLLIVSPLFTVMFIIVSPRSMGIEISRKSTSVDNVLAICALIIRSPLYIAPMIHSIGLLLGIISFLSGITILLIFKEYEFISEWQE
jgi:DNA-directed RNA polymerase subunit M/transcription elongation factor TFIIS